MKAVNENIISKERAALQNVIPLDTPYSVVIDPCNLCNFKCNFCAMHRSEYKLAFSKKMMSIELFKKIIDDLSAFPQKLRVLRLTGGGEPLLNPLFIDMVKYAKMSKVADYIETVTNGSCFNMELNSDLANCGLDRIRISIEATTTEGYYENANIKIDINKIVNGISDLYQKCNGKTEIYIKTVDAAVPTKKHKEYFYELFGDICDKIFIDKVIPLWSDWNEIHDYCKIEGQKGMHGQIIRKVQICPYPFYSIVVNPDGQVTACCADWKREFVIGDVSLESLYNIWNGDRMRKFWIDMSSGKKDRYSMCKKCVLPSFDCNDYIDEYGDEITKKLIGAGNEKRQTYKN